MFFVFFSFIAQDPSRTQKKKKNTKSAIENIIQLKKKGTINIPSEDFLMSGIESRCECRLRCRSYKTQHKLLNGNQNERERKKKRGKNTRHGHGQDTRWLN